MTDEQEREHCEKMWMSWDYCAPETGLEMLLRERAAAFREGAAAGRQDFVNMRKANEDLARAFIELQSKHERLTAAARAVPTPGMARTTQEGWNELVIAVEKLRIEAAGRGPNGQLEKPTSGALANSPETVNWRERYEALTQLARDSRNQTPGAGYALDAHLATLQNQPKGEGGEE